MAYIFTYKDYDRYDEMSKEEQRAFNAWIDEEDMKYRDENEPKLQKFYETHIKGHTSEELKLGNDICMKAYEWHKEVPKDMQTGYVFDDSLTDYYLGRYHSEINPCPIEVLRKAYNLANDFSFYSDYHKDVYGYRPRHL